MPNHHDAGGIESLHDRAIPKDVRESDAILTRVRLSGENNEFESMRTWRLSPLGVEIIQKKGNGGTWSIGDRLDLQIVIEGRRSEFTGLVMSEKTLDSEIDLIGIRFLSTEKPERKKSSDDRRAMRWLCSEEYLPKAISPAPGRFNDFIGFKLKNISSNGLLLVTSTKNSFLIPNMRLTLSVNLPMVGETVLNVEIIWIRVGRDGARDILEVGTKLIDLTQTAKSLLGQYLVQFSEDVELAELVAEGFIPNNIAQGIEFYALKSEADYTDLLEIRRKSTGHLDTPLTTYVHEYDQVSRIIVGKVHNTVVVSARVRYPELKDELICEKYMEWDDSTARTDQLLEIDGITLNCPPAIEDDALLALFRYICTCCTSATRQNVLLYTSKEAKFFEDIGWTCLHSEQGKNTLIGNAYEAIKGRSTSPIKWNYVWRKSAQFMLRAGVIKPAGTDQLILKIYFAFGSLTSLLFRLRQWRSRISEKDMFDS